MLKKIKEKLEFLKFIDPFYYVDTFIMPKVNKDNNEIVALALYLITAFVSAWLAYTLLGLLLNTSAPLVVVVSGSMEPNLYRGDVMLLQGINSKELKAPEISFNYPTLNNVQLSDLSQTICVDNQGNINSCDYFRKLLILNLIKAQDFTTQKIVFVNNKEITLNKEGDIIVYFSEEAGIPIIHRVVAKLKANDGYYFLTKGDSKLNPLIDQDKVLSLYPLPEKKVVGKTILRIPLIGYVKLLLIDDLQVLLFGCPKGMQCVLP